MKSFNEQLIKSCLPVNASLLFLRSWGSPAQENHVCQISITSKIGTYGATKLKFFWWGLRKAIKFKQKQTKLWGILRSKLHFSRMNKNATNQWRIKSKNITSWPSLKEIDRSTNNQFVLRTFYCEAVVVGFEGIWVTNNQFVLPYSCQTNNPYMNTTLQKL